MRRGLVRLRWRAAAPEAALAAIALAAVALAACGPRVRPNEPTMVGVPPGPVGGDVPVASASAPAPRRVALGQMCLDRAAGRPALAVIAARQTSWSFDPDELERLVARGAVRDFAVLSYEGRRAGVFSAVGAVDLGTTMPVAAGGYAGAAPCDAAADGLACAEVLGRCALAVAGFDDVEGGGAPDLRAGDACLDAGKLWLDVDGDGATEAFEAAAFLDDRRGPSDEIEGVPAARQPCEGRFAIRNLVASTEPKIWLGVDLVGVLDADEDGVLELVVQYRYPDGRTWAIYGADRTSPTTLRLVGEIEPWATTP